LGLLSFEERQKEMATLKVLGFSTKKLRALMLQQNIILSVLGTVLGIPLGSIMLRILVNSLGDSMDIPTSCSILYICISFIITVLVSVIVNILFTTRIKNMNMVEEIKNAE
jgi:putative ABC transport system permease protein